MFSLDMRVKRLQKLASQLLVVTLVALLSACATAPAVVSIHNPPREIPLEVIENSERPVIAFVLGSGAARGFAHVGVLDVLDRHGIKADIVVGSSSGSVVAALYAADIRNDALLDAAQNLNIAELTDWAFPNRGVVRGERLQHYVNQLVQDQPIEGLPTKFVAVATDLVNGKLTAFNHGNTGMAVRASSSIPGIVQPLTIGEQEYVDGGLVSPVPVRIARKMGADIVIAVDVSRSRLPHDQLNSATAVMHQAILISMQQITEAEVQEADVIIRPEVGAILANEFEQRDQLVEAGKRAALDKITIIKQLIFR